MKPGYADTLHQLLSVYRFLAYGLAVVLIQVLPISQGQDISGDILVVLSLMGVYTFLKVFSPVRWRETSLATYVVLGGDVVVAILLLFFTGGLDSGYIFYSLLPLATASLLFPERVAWTVAGLTGATPLIVHTLGSLLSDRYTWILDGNHLPLLLLYAAVCLLIATMAYHTNVNIRRRIVQEAMAASSRRPCKTSASARDGSCTMVWPSPSTTSGSAPRRSPTPWPPKAMPGPSRDWRSSRLWFGPPMRISGRPLTSSAPTR
jgi:hypothetical protein